MAMENPECRFYKEPTVNKKIIGQVRAILEEISQNYFHLDEYRKTYYSKLLSVDEATKWLNDLKELAEQGKIDNESEPTYNDID